METHIWRAQVVGGNESRQRQRRCAPGAHGGSCPAGRLRVGVRRVLRALDAVGLSMRDVDALLISHEHSDHIRELPRFVMQRTAVLSTRVRRARPMCQRNCGRKHARNSLQLADVEIVAIPVCHDAADPCGFLIRTAEGSVTVLTDLGCPSSAATEAIAESRLVVLEANHDEAMLRRGPYPQRLQRRILSDSGHLSNAGCADLLARAIRDRLSRLRSGWPISLRPTTGHTSPSKRFSAA